MLYSDLELMGLNELKAHKFLLDRIINDCYFKVRNNNDKIAINCNRWSLTNPIAYNSKFFNDYSLMRVRVLVHSNMLLERLISLSYEKLEVTNDFIDAINH